MIITKGFYKIGGLAILFALTLSFNAFGQSLLVNEVEVDPPGVGSDRCQYVEIKGAPGASVPANTYFISVNNDNDNPGFLNAAVNIGGQTIGSNGILTLLNTVGGACPGRTYGSGTTLFNYFNGLTLGDDAEGFYLVTSSTALFAGQDIDANNDGTPEVALTFIDGFNFIFNPQEQYKYGPGPNILTTFLGSGENLVPDAATRLPNNTTPFDANAFYYGEISIGSEGAVQYIAPFGGSFPVGGKLTPGAPNNVQARARFDFDGDGRSDISVFRPSEGNWYIQRSTAGFTAFPFGASTDTIVPGDYDGDNRTDFAVFRPSDGNWYIQGSTAGFSAFPFGASTDIPVPGDYDGDGRTDIAVVRQSGGTTTWYIRGSTAGIYGVVFGAATDKPAPEDYDGDGKTDIAVVRPNGGALTWFIQGSTAGFSSIVFGATTDLLVPADYDGDGKADVAVVRQSGGTSTWYINGSTAGFSALGFGATTDLPAPADYDGDGKTDVAVFRPANGTWYIQNSTSGFLGFPFGASNDRPIPNAYVR